MGDTTRKKPVNLDRTFVQYNDKDDADIEQLSRYDTLYGSFTWAKLLEKKRSVILAEAGSGKSTELEARRDKLVVDGEFAFLATVQEVAKEGLEQALGPKYRAQFRAWKASDKRAYFFIDSVDEAKLDNIRFKTAMRQLADGIEAGKARATVVLSSRVTDWEKVRDLDTLKDMLATQGEVSASEIKTPEDILVDILNNNYKQPTVKEDKPLVVVMTGLNPDRIKIYAAAQGVERLNDFMAAIDAGNLWSLARRPADLDWLISYWDTHKKFANYSVILEDALRVRLKEPDREAADPISEERAMEALERIGATLVFGRRTKIKIQDTDDPEIEPDEVDLKTILPDWTPEHIVRLRTRAVFDPAAFGTVMLHGDNEGAVRSFLAAKWLLRRLKKPGFSKRNVRDLLFADTYGVPLVVPSAQETAAFLSIFDSEIASETAKRDPFVLLSGGDPASLSSATRKSVLIEAVRRMAEDGDRHHWDRDSLRRFATPDLLPTIKLLWAKYKTHRHIKGLLAQMLSLGKLSGAQEIIDSAVFDANSDALTLTFGARALLSVSDAKKRDKYAKYVSEKVKSLPETAVWEALDGMFLQEIGIADFFKVLDGLKTNKDVSGYNFQEHVPRIVSKALSKNECLKLLSGLLKRLGKPDENDDMDKPRDKGLIAAIAHVTSKLLSLSSQNEVPKYAATAAFRVGEKQRYTQRQNHEFNDTLRSSPERRRIMLYAARAHFENASMLQGRELNSVFQLDFLGWHPGLNSQDMGWLLEDFRKSRDQSERTFLMTGALGVWRDEGKPAHLLDAIREAADDQHSKEMVEAWLKPPDDGMDSATRRQLEQSRKSAKAQRAARDKSWVEFLKPLKENPSVLRDFKPKNPGDVSNALYNLWKLLNAIEHHNSRFAIKSVDALRPVLGDALTDEFAEVLIRYWRRSTPKLRSDREEDKLNQLYDLDLMALASVSLEAKRTAGWAQSLSGAEATKAAQFATLELNGYPFWFPDLLAAHPKEASAVLIKEMEAEIGRVNDNPRYRTLRDIDYCPPAVAEAVAPALLKKFPAIKNPSGEFLKLGLSVLATGLKGADRARFT